MEPGPVSDIEIVDQSGAHVVALSGEHDLSTAGDIGDALADAFGRGSAVVMDLTDATFVDSSVFVQILMAAERADTSDDTFAIVIKPGGFVERTVHLAGLPQMMSAFPTRIDAINAIT